MNRSIVSLIGGAVLAVVALVIMNGRMAAHRAQPTTVVQPVAQPQIATTMVVTAAADVPFGQTLTRGDLTIVQWPSAAAPEGGFSSLDEVFSGPAEPRLMRAVIRGEPLQRAKVAGFGDASTLSYQIRPDMRAATIRVNDVSGVAGFLSPGDRVDVFLTRQLGADQGHLATDVILQNIAILGVDQHTQAGGERNGAPARTVTVEVTPQEGQKLALAQQIGTLSLALRNAGNGEQVEAQRVSTHDLGVADDVPVHTGPVVRVRRGASAATNEAVR